METKNNKRTIRNLIIFTILVLASGWLGRGMDVLTGSTSSEGMGIWIIAPLVISFLLRAFAGDGWRDLGIKPALPGNGLWYAVSILAYPVCATLILGIGLALGVISFSAMATLGVFGQAFALLFVSQVLTNILEEFGFRGYLAPKMYTLPLNTFVAHVLVGLIWGLWHTPYLAAITPYATESLITLLPRFLLGTIAASIVYGEIRLLTNSVWPAVLMQTAGGMFVGALMANNLITISSGGWLFTPVLEGGLMIVLFTVLGIGIYRWRAKRATTPQT
ncbi:MAG: CPBP family intramembrane metalloprotease [Anaerolineae bacterium]|nr:CPBP family intramembrane metalloprotease [Anaerolineae bacterium]